jgi:hypothetical protein
MLGSALATGKTLGLNSNAAFLPDTVSLSAATTFKTAFVVLWVIDRHTALSAPAPEKRCHSQSIGNVTFDKPTPFTSTSPMR